MGDGNPPSGAGTDLAYISADDVDGMTVADVMHAGVASLPATATVGELRAWFAVSPSRRLAVLTGEGRYAGALTPADLAPATSDDGPASELAREHATLAPDLAAAAGRDLVAAAEGRRMPVVDEAGRFLGVLALTTDLQFFACRRTAPPG
ncbi:MAG: CBS domain-containing protein [Solirubrobacteraceae bacterium]|nr:CBS domain-containing protein [Solirubrobacteraceae bacterium]